MDEDKEIINSHETAFIGSFVKSGLKVRFKEVFTKEKCRKSKNRKKHLKWAQLLIEFEHWVDNSCVNALPLSEQTQKRKKGYLTKMGALELCYVISEAKELDGKIMPIDSALSYLMTTPTYGTILSCIPGKLAYYEHVERSSLTWVLKRKTNTRK